MEEYRGRITAKEVAGRVGGLAGGGVVTRSWVAPAVNRRGTVLTLTDKQAKAVAKELSQPARSEALARMVAQALKALRQERRLTEEKLRRRATI